MKYSVIIPIYNAERTLRRCLDSLLPQLNSDIEILLINDGSIDASGDICKEYLAMNDSFRYYEQDNAGASAARNKGIENAVGEYLLFVDSDDYVDKEYFITIDDYLRQYGSDLLIFCYCFISRDYNQFSLYNEEKMYAGIEAIKQIALLSKKQRLYSLCNKVFVRRIVIENHLHFNSLISVGEDSAFVFQYIFHIESLSTCNRLIYYVDESTNDSLSRKQRKNLCNDLIVSYKAIESHLDSIDLNNCNDKQEYKKILSRAYYRSSYSCFLEISRWNCSNAEKKEEIEKVCSAYRQNRIMPVGMESNILAIPVLWNLTALICVLLVNR